MAETPDVKKLGLRKLLEDNNVEKFLEITELQERTKARQEFNDLIKPFSMLGDVIAKHAKGVFVDEVLEDVKKISRGVENALADALDQESKTLKKELTQLVNTKDEAARADAIRTLESRISQAEAKLASDISGQLVAEVNRLLPSISADAKLTDDEIEEITNNAALSVESQMDGLISAYIKDAKINPKQIDGLKAFIEKQIPEVDFSEAVIDWRQIKNVPNLGGGGAGARTLYWLNDVDISTTAPTNGQALVYNSTTQKWSPGNVDSLPSQTGNSGKYLTTDGTDASWATLAGGGDMAAATYDAAAITEQLVGITAAQTITNKTIDADNNTISNLAIGAEVAGNVSDLTDVTITTIASGELLKWNGSAWINNTLAEAGIAAASHTHAASDITSGTLTHERGGLEADVSAYSGLIKIAAGSTSQAVADTDYQSVPAEGAFANGDKTKLDGIEASADVTDATNVAAAGAVMADGSGNDITGDIVFTEKADHSSTPGAGKGYLWVKNTAPSTLIFTDDAGTDTTLGSGGGGLNNVVEDTTPELGGHFTTGVYKLQHGSGGYARFNNTSTSGLIDLSSDLVPTDSSGVGLFIDADYTVNQSGTAGYTAIDLDVTETGTGSGTKLLANFKVGGTTKFSVANSGTVDLAASASLGFNGTAILSDSAGTMTLSNVDALDATTEATIEAAIDTLSNLTTVGTLTSGNADAIVSAASTTTAGKVELATAAETDTGTDTGRAITPDGLAGSNFGERNVQIVVFDYGTATATGDGKAYFHIPSNMDGMDLVEVHAEVITAGTTGTTDIQIHNIDNALDMLSTKLTIDSAETGSDTAATAAVINTSNDHVNTNDVIRIDVDAVSTTPANGLIVTLTFRLP